MDSSHRLPERPNASLGPELSPNVFLVPQVLLSHLKSEMTRRPLPEWTGVEVRTLLHRELAPILVMCAALQGVAVLVLMAVADLSLPEGLPDLGFLLALYLVLWRPAQILVLGLIAGVANRMSSRHEPIGPKSRLGMSIRIAPRVAAAIALAIAIPAH